MTPPSFINISPYHPHATALQCTTHVLHRTTSPSVHHNQSPRGYSANHLPFPEYVQPTYLIIPRCRSTPLLIHSTHYLLLHYSFSLSPAFDSVNMYIPSFTFIYDTLGKHVSTRWPTTLPMCTPHQHTSLWISPL